MNCNICFENRTKFWKCDVCIYSHCDSCFNEIIRLDNPRCPFCRNSITFEEKPYKRMFDFNGDKYLQFLFRNNIAMKI